MPTPLKGDLPFPKKLEKDIEKSLNFEPSLLDLGFNKDEVSSFKEDKRACYKFRGGETNGLKRV